MPRKILVTGGHTEPVHFVEAPAQSEHELQQILLTNPQLIPANDLGLDDELLVVGRETPMASGKVDLLCLSRSGELVIIEFKTGPQNPDFRHAIAQAIDYGSDLWMLRDWGSFDRGVVHRYLTSANVVAKYKGCADLRGAAALAWSLTDEEWEQLTARLDVVIGKGDFHFVIAAQRFTDPMAVSVSYLNEATQVGKYFLVELIRLDGPSQIAYAAQVVHRPEKRPAPGPGPGPQASREVFLAAIDDAAYREAMSELLDNVTALGLVTYWGAKGASFRLKSPDQAEPISVGWAFLPGDQWYFAKHVTLGVDPNTLQKHPSVEQAILKFCEQLTSIPGGKPAGKLARMFEPGVFTAVHADVVQLLAELKENASGDSE